MTTFLEICFVKQSIWSHDCFYSILLSKYKISMKESCPWVAPNLWTSPNLTKLLTAPWIQNKYMWIILLTKKLQFTCKKYSWSLQYKPLFSMHSLIWYLVTLLKILQASISLFSMFILQILWSMSELFVTMTYLL